MSYGKCNRCGDTEKEAALVKGKCLACAELTSPKGETVEVPKEALKKLASLAQSRHPTACNDVAPVFNGLVEDELDVDLDLGYNGGGK